MKEQIKLENVRFKYLNSIVFQNINLDINSGDYIFITGGNGSGKSTLIKLILGLIKPVSGVVTCTQKFIAQNVGYVSQSHNVDKDFPITVEELISLECDVSKRSCAISVKNHLALFNTENLSDKKISELSGGELQKVLICRALVTEPLVLILDEPTNNLDKEARNNLYNLLRNLNKQGKTIIHITHSHFELDNEYKNAICMEIIDGNLVRINHND